MRILLLSPNFYPEKTGIGVTATDCARFLVMLGHEVQVITSVPYYPEWEIHPAYRGRLIVKETVDGIPVTRIWLYVPKKIRTATRIVHELSFAFLLALRSAFLKYDLMLCISPPITAAALVAFISAVRCKPFWCYIKDIQPDAAICLGMLKNPVMIAVSRALERFIYHRAAKILVLSEGMKRNIVAKNVSADKVTVVPDSIDADELDVPVRESLFRARYCLEDRFIVLYSGNLGVKQNPEIIVECARLFQKDERVFFAVAGEGAQKKRMQELVLEHGLKNIALYPLCEREHLGDMLCSADLLLAPQRKEVIDIVVPSKLLSYLSTGTPVIASAHPDSEIARLLLDNDAGFLCPPENAAALAGMIREVREDRDTALAKGKKAKQLLREMFDHKKVLERYYAPLFSYAAPAAEEGKETGAPLPPNASV